MALDFWQTVLSLLLAVLITFALALNISKLDGPGEVFDKLRISLGAYDLGPNGQPDSVMGRFIGCPYCTGTWLAIPVTLLLWPITWHSVLLWLATVGGLYFLLGIATDARLG